MADQINADELTPDQVFEHMPDYFDSSKAGATTATIQFNLSGEQGGSYYMRIADATAVAEKGEAEAPNLTLTADAWDLVKIVLGQMDATAAFMSGKLKIKGDMGLAIKLQGFFKKP